MSVFSARLPDIQLGFTPEVFGLSSCLILLVKYSNFVFRLASTLGRTLGLAYLLQGALLHDALLALFLLLTNLRFDFLVPDLQFIKVLSVDWPFSCLYEFLKVFI